MSNFKYILREWYWAAMSSLIYSIIPFDETINHDQWMKPMQNLRRRLGYKKCDLRRRLSRHKIVNRTFNGKIGYKHLISVTFWIMVHWKNEKYCIFVQNWDLGRLFQINFVEMKSFQMLQSTKSALCVDGGRVLAEISRQHRCRLRLINIIDSS